jgi:hypothetical protein
LFPMREAEPEKRIETSEADQRGPGRKPEAAQASGSNFPGARAPTGSSEPDLIERMRERGNLLKALQAVEANRGAAGVAGLEVKQLRSHLREHWAEIKEQIRSGTYEPQPVRRVDIPKPGGRRYIKYSARYGKRDSHRTVTGFDPDAVRHRRSKRPRLYPIGQTVGCGYGLGEVL